MIGGAIQRDHRPIASNWFWALIVNQDGFSVSATNSSMGNRADVSTVEAILRTRDGNMGSTAGP